MERTDWAVYAEPDPYSGAPEFLGHIHNAFTPYVAKKKVLSKYPQAWRLNGLYEVVYIDEKKRGYTSADMGGLCIQG